MTLVVCAAGLLVMIFGAELLVRNGGRLAARLGVPPIVVGLTIVALGTSAPELAVGVRAVLDGNGDLAVGNIAGTNTVNLLLILGLSAAMAPLVLHLQTIKLDLPVMIVVALVMAAMAWDGALTRTEGMILIAVGIVYTLAVVRAARREQQAMRAAYAREFGERPYVRGETGRTILNLVLLLAGIAIVVVGADWLVQGATDLARLLGVSDAFIGLTVVAIGTSSPELVTTIVSTLRNQRDIAVGNLLGSSIYNIVFILGATLLVVDAVPVSRQLVAIDIPVMVAASVLCVPVFISGRRVSRAEGALFVALYLAYLTYLIVART